MKRLTLVCALLCVALPAAAQSGGMKGMDMRAATRTVTLDHEPVASMSWPAQKIEIDFEQRGKDHVVTKVK